MNGTAAARAGRGSVRGRIKAISTVPQPGSVLNRDAILVVHLTEVESPRGTTSHPEVVFYLWGMRDDRLTGAARYRPGQNVTLHLIPWEQAQRRSRRTKP